MLLFKGKAESCTTKIGSSAVYNEQRERGKKTSVGWCVFRKGMKKKVCEILYERSVYNVAHSGFASRKGIFGEFEI